MGPARAAVQEGSLTSGELPAPGAVGRRASASNPLRLVSLSDAIGRGFQYSSGRMIGITRVVLAAVFLFALWIDPDQPAREELSAYSLLLGYLMLAFGLALMSWRSWWWDYTLAWPMMIVDVVAFLSAVVFSEGAASDFTSPFLAFFAFLMLAATIRWDWRLTVITGLVVTTLYLLIGLYISTILPDFDIYRFGRRISYMLVLTLVLAWFGLQRREQAIERFIEHPGKFGASSELLAQALQYALDQSFAHRGVLAWAEYEEPDVSVQQMTAGDHEETRLGPEEFDPESGFAGHACLFDRPRRRCLVSRRGMRPAATRTLVSDDFAQIVGVEEGVALPLVGLTGHGELLLTGIRGMSADHVGIGVLIGREMTAAFDRQATLTLANQTALTRVRDSLARDLHDSVAQSLAGTAMRLEGLRAWIRGGGDPEGEIEAIKRSLREEQRHVRSLIARLRLGSTGEDLVELSATIRPLLNALSLQWGVVGRASLGDNVLMIPAWLAHELGQILREAVANAVRHGQASKIDLTVEYSKGELRMVIADDGTGFPGGDAGPGPWSIGGRVDKIDGTLHVTTGLAGTQLEITVRLGEIS